MSTPRTNTLPLLIASIAVGAIAIVSIALSKFISGPLILLVVAAAVVAFVVSLVLLGCRAPRSVGWVLGRLALALLGAVIAGYIVLFAVIYFGQDAIANRTNAFFQPKSLVKVAAARIDAPDVERLELGTPDGALLRGWLVQGGTQGKAPLVIYFGGSGSESSHVAEKARLLAPWSVALINYRGFGESTGSPTPATALADALWIYDILAQRSDVDATHIVPMGYSMGTGMAVHLVAQRPVAGVVLFAPYDSLKLVNPGSSPLYAPLQPLMKPYFNPIDMAGSISAPLLALVGTQDRVFPPNVARRLASQWGGPSEAKLYAGEGHKLSEQNDASWLDVRSFLSTLQPTL